MKSQLFQTNSQILIQGMTGKEGSRMAEWMLNDGMQVVAGVTPGKGGQEVFGKPIFHSIKEAKDTFSDISISCIVVPGGRVLGAVEEALQAGIRCLYILSENMPIQDVYRAKEIVEREQGMMLGPSSVGYLQFPKFRLGYLGGQSPFFHIHEGGIAIVSASGGMANEILMGVSRHGFGIRLAMAVGGDRVVGTSLSEAVTWSASLPEVERLVVFAEPGNPVFTRLIREGNFVTKPIILFLAGISLDLLPRGLPYGHTGTMLGEEGGSFQEIIESLKKKCIPCIRSLCELVELLSSNV